MSDNFSAEDLNFEKVEAIPQADQDENVTSSVLTGDMAEEDRYESNTAQNATDMLSDFLSGGNEVIQEASPEEPLIAFGSAVPEVAEETAVESKPKMATETVTDYKPSQPHGDATEGLMGVPGMETLCCWMRNVDPRDDSKMSEPSDVQGLEPSAPPKEELGHFVGDQDLNGCEHDTDSDSAHSEHGSNPGSIITTSEEEYSSSGDESDTESSDSDSHMMDTTGSLDNGDSTVKYVESTMSETSDTELDKAAAKVDIDIPVDFTSKMDESEKDQDTTDGFHLNYGKSDFESARINQGRNTSSSDSESNVSDSGARAQVSMDFTDGANFNGHNSQSLNDADMCVPLSTKIGMTNEDMDSIFAKLTKDEDGDIDTQNEACEMPPFSMGPEPVSLTEGDSSDDERSSTSSKSNSSGDEVVCTDSDVTDEEDNVGEWNPSPVYEFSTQDDNDSDDNDEMRINKDIYDPHESHVLPGYEYGNQEECELNTLRKDVKGLMEEMETLVQTDDRETNYPSLYGANASKVEDEVEINPEQIQVVHDIPVECGKSVLSDPSQKKDDSNDLYHVKFHTSSNMIFYDPESAVLERISVEVSDDLNDSEPEVKEEEVQVVDDSPITFMDDEENDDIEEVEVADQRTIAPEPTNVSDVANNEPDIVQVKEETLRKISGIATQLTNSAFRSATTEVEKGDQNVDSTPDTKVIPEMDKGLENDNNQENVTDINDDQIPLAEDEINDITIEETDFRITQEPKDVIEIDTQDQLQTSIDEEVVLRKKDTESPPQTERVDLESMIIHEDEVTVESANEPIDTLVESSEIAEYQNEIEEKEPDLAVEQPVISDVEEVEEMVVLREQVKREETTPPRDDVESMIIHDLPDQDFKNVVQSIEPLEHSGAKVDVQTVNEKVEIEQESVECLDEKEAYDVDSEKEVDSQDQIIEGTGIKTCEQINANQSALVEQMVTEPCVNESPVEETVIESAETIRQEIIPIITPKAEHVENKVETKDTVLKSNNEISNADKIREDKRKARTAKGNSIAQVVIKEVLELIYWKDVKKTGIVFGSMMFVLLSLACCTILSVLAYLSLAGLAITLSFRLYKSVMQAVQKTSDVHPFKNLLNMDLELREDVVQGAADKIATNINNLSGELRRLFLVEDYVDSLKFGLLLWLMTYVGSWFNGMTLFILGVVAIFTLPKVYEVYQGPIDQNVNLVRAQLNNIMAQVSSKIPFPKKKVKAQ